MALWVKVQSILGNVRSLYGSSFPIEVRDVLAQWLEDKISSAVDPAHPQYEQYASLFLTELIQQLESKAASMDSPDTDVNREKLTEAAAMFKQRYATCPVSLFQLVQYCISTEFRFVQEVENAMTSDVFAGITRDMSRLRQITIESEKDFRKVALDQEAFFLHYHECTKSNNHLQQLQTQSQNPQTWDLIQKVQVHKTQQEQKLSQMAASVMQQHLTLASKFKIIVDDIQGLKGPIEMELMKWKRNQQLALIGQGKPTTLNIIQEWCELLAEIIWSNKRYIEDLQQFQQLQQKMSLGRPDIGNFLPDLSTKITALLRSLVTNAFIVETQPPRVMKTNKVFQSAVRLLLGVTLNVNLVNSVVRVSIINEAQARSLLKSDRTGRSEVCGEIINCTSRLEYQVATRHLSANFGNLTLKNIKRLKKKRLESVSEEKFCLLFQSQFSMGGTLNFKIWTISLPIVVIVHGNQEPQAWATITWDNAFSGPGRVPFIVPEEMAMSAVVEALNRKFSSATGRQIDESQLRFLAEKAFGDLECSDYSAMMISWTQFCKTPLKERSFTFWEWFYAVTRLTREHLKDLWMDGLIHGFIRRKEAEEMLSSCANGTFLLRFSDSQLGGITIAWAVDGEVYMLQPFTNCDLLIRSLPDRIADLVHLTYLYPDKPKDEAFKKYYSPLESILPSSNGYVKPFLMTYVPGWDGPGYGMNTPQESDTNTPQPSHPSHSTDSWIPRDTTHTHTSFDSQLTASVLSFTGTKCVLPDEELPLIEKPFGDLTFNPLTWPQSQIFAGV